MTLLLAADPQDTLANGGPQAILAMIVMALVVVIIKVIHYHITTVAKIEADHKAERDAWFSKLEKAEIERRQEAERLLREQQDIMKQVMVTTQAIGQNLEENTKAMERLISMVERLGASGPGPWPPRT